MQYENLDVNIESKNNTTTIRRGKHDKENPYVQISRAMARDPLLSVRAKGTLLYLLSLPTNWVTRPRQVAQCLGISKNQIYSILNELIKAGYATKETIKNRGKFSSVVYTFYEDKLDLHSEIKENNTVSQKPDAEKPCPENPDTVSGTLSNKDYKEINTLGNSSLKVPPPPDPIREQTACADEAKASVEILNSPKISKAQKNIEDFTPKVREVANKMIKCLVSNKHNYIIPRNLTPFLTHVDYLMRLDNRDSNLIIDVFSWALADSFWADKMYKPNPAEYLRKQFDQLEMKMNAKPPQKERKFAPSSKGTYEDSPLYQAWEANAL